MAETEEVRRKKDPWDKLSAVGPILAGLIISGVGWWFTYNFNQRQISLQEVQTVGEFIPYLLGTQESKELAILAMTSLTNARLSVELALRYPSPGTRAALQTISTSADNEARGMADSALQVLDDKLHDLVNKMFAGDRATRVAATTELVRKWNSDPRVLELVIAKASDNPEHGSGRINTLVLLENFELPILAGYAPAIDSLLQKLEEYGLDQTDQHVDSVRARFNPS